MTGSVHVKDTVPNHQDLLDAYTRVKPFVHRTPVFKSETLDQIAGCTLYFKCENLQKVGAFKYRGATNAVLQLSETERACGVATHSSGNHGQALAKAAQVNGIASNIVMPNNAPQVKVDAIKGYGGNVTFCEPTLAARESTLKKVLDQTGAVEIHPYNNYKIIAGASTAAQEFLEQQTTLDILLTPVGGGGLLSGTCLTAHYLNPNIEVWAAEPKNVNDAFLSLKAGKIIPAPSTPTIADGLKTSLGSRNFKIIKEHVYGVLTCTEEEIISAMKLIWQRLKLVVEPSSATVLAVVLKNPALFHDKNVGLIISGGNIDTS